MDIALIGLSIKCANINTLQQFIELLRNKRVHTIQPDKERMINSKIEVKDAYHPWGYLDRVDLFDHEFFNISKGEANTIDPSHRMVLEGVCKAIENSGYSLDEKTFESTGLFTSFPANMYNVLFQSDNKGMDFVGGISSIGGGRVANILNIKGPVINIDTACSSSLVAVHQALKCLESGGIETAIVAGSRLSFMFAEANSLENDPILASDGICKAFDDLADGTAGGEGMAVIVLKRLKEAVRDNDNIVAVIKGSAINNDGSRSTSVTAPSPVAQKEVILSACKNANIPIASVGYIETHGTGTKLGDPIEYKGIKEAFSSQNEPYNVHLGTLKPNIGHLDNMAGLFGLLKATAVLKEKEFFPLANFSSINKFIEEDKNIILPKERKSWIIDGPRRAGVSSFGLSGTNSHVILEEYIPNQNQNTQLVDTESGYWLKVAAKSKSALKQYIDNVYNDISNTSNLKDFAYTLNSGRSDYKYRLSVSGKDINQIKESLLDKKKDYEKITPNRYNKIALLYLSDDVLNIENFLECNEFSTMFSSQKVKIDKNEIESSISKTIAFQTTLFKFLSEKGFTINQLICNGDISKTSKLIIDGNEVISKDLKFDSNATIDIEKLKIIAKNYSENNTLLVLVGNNSILIETILAAIKEVDAAGIDLLKSMSTEKWHSLWSHLYNNGLEFNWKEFYKNGNYNKVEAPTYPFKRISCWNEIINPLFFKNQDYQDTSSKVETVSVSKDKNEEDVVLNILSEVLQNFDIKLTDDFFELGGNSIVGIQFINRINELYDISLIFDDLFDCYEINDIINLVKDEIGKKENNVVKDDLKISETSIDIFEASNSQQRMWIESQFEGSFYNIDLMYHLKGSIDVSIFKRTLIELIRKHNSLRSIFFWDDSGTIQQKVNDIEKINVDDFFNYYNETDVSLLDLKKTYKNFKFNLETGPLFKAAIIDSDKQENSNLIFVFHHIIFDGWSVGIFLKDFVTIYKQILNETYKSEYKNSDYLNYLVWLKDNLRAEKIEPYKLYWQNKLEHINSNLPLGNLNPQSDKGAKINYIIDQRLLNKINNLANKNRTTPFVVLMASVRTFLYRLTQENFVIGTPVSGRVKKEFESTVGLFINTLPIYTEVDNDRSFTDCLLSEKTSIAKALEYQVYPYDMILNDLKTADKQSFFDVLVVLQNQNNRAGLLQASDLPFEIEMDTNQVDQLARFNLTFTFYQAPDFIELELEYKVDVFNASFIHSLMDSYFHYFESFLELPEKKIEEYSLLSEKQYNIIYEFGESKLNRPIEKTIVDLFEEQVKKTPNAIAIIFEQIQLTYKELNEKANQLGGYLREKFSIMPEDLIGIKLDRSHKMLISVLGILKSGAAYVPIDPNYPQERIDYIQENSNCKTVIDESFFESFLQNEQQYSHTNLSKINNPNDLAYVIYTSGTTGKPKGVMVEHSSVVSISDNWKEHYNLDKIKVNLLQIASISFDVFVGDIGRSLLTGGKMIICPNDIKLNPEDLYELMYKQEVSILEGTPSLLLPLMKYIDDEDKEYRFLKVLIFGSDSFNNKDYNNLKDRFGEDIRIINSYGATEATIDSTYYDGYKIDVSGFTPIGKPFSNTEIRILDVNYNQVPQGIIGEVYIGGYGLARGYFRNENLTAERFIKNPFNDNQRLYKTGDLGRWLPDGNIEFLGRQDNQVKIRGHRIELGEIETTILQFSSLIKQTIVEVKINKGEKVLVAYLISTSDIDKSALRIFLLEKLPDFMIPSFYCVLDILPLTPNGKINRKALPEISEDDLVKKEYVAPRNEIEEKMVSIWQQVLDIDKIGIADDFFELGGHSLNATKLISIIHKDFNIKLSIVEMFNNTTLESLSLLIENTLAYRTSENFNNTVEESENFTL